MDSALKSQLPPNSVARMDEVEISSLVKTLDSTIPKEKAHFAIYTYGGGTDESFTQGNRIGYLRFGIEFLKAGLQISDEGNDETAAELGYLINEDSDIHCHYFKVSDEPRAEEYKADWKDEFIPTIIIGCLVLILVLAAIGLVTVARYVFVQAFG